LPTAFYKFDAFKINNKSIGVSLLKRLISDTAIYGTSSILARGLNYLLTFLIADIVATSEFGIFTQLYAMVAFLLVILTHGMETSFFRHVNLYDKSKNIFGTAFLSVATFTAIFLVASLVFLEPISVGLKYPNQQNYIHIFIWIIVFDVLAAVPFANLRHEGKAKHFANLKIFNIGLTIALNVFFLMIAPKLMLQNNTVGQWMNSWYQPENKVLYVFLSNLIASIATFLLHLPQIAKISFKIDKAVYKQMLWYALPIMLLGCAGTINEMMDRIILRSYLPYNDEANLAQLGIYGFAYKLSMIMSLFLQAYKFAVEPILFAEVKKENAQKTYALIMKYYVITISVLFMVMILNLPFIEYFLFEVVHYNPDYKAAFKIVPVLLAANAFLGIYFNIATWYKVSDRTLYGAYIAFFGAAITIVLNIVFVPIYEIEASAWTTLICYIAMAIVGLWLGQKFYPIPYHYSRLLLYLGIAALTVVAWLLLRHLPFYVLSGLSVVLASAFIWLARKLERNRKFH
jgi:O-antigen/teichoic acid export membrane protein